MSCFLSLPFYAQAAIVLFATLGFIALCGFVIAMCSISPLDFEDERDSHADHL